MAESELFERGLQARREVLGAEYVDANLADDDDGEPTCTASAIPATT